MGFNLIRKKDQGAVMQVKLDQDYYLDAQKTKAVKSGSKEARFLLGRKGQMITEADAKKYGIGKKSAAKSGNKAAKKSSNKSAKK